MIEGGYSGENIDSFHLVCLPYLGDKFFPDKNSKILDIGAGAGHCLMSLKLKGWQNLYVVDIDDFYQGFLA